MRTDLPVPYSWIFNPPDLNGADINNVEKWLRDNGLPATTTPALKKEVAAWPGGITIEYDLVWSNAGLPPLEQDICALLNDPGIALVELMKYFNFGNPNNHYVYPPVVQGQPEPPKPPAQAADPIGVPEGTDALGRPMFAKVANDYLGNGAIYKDARGTFQKTVTNSPFGGSAWWTLTVPA